MVNREDATTLYAKGLYKWTHAFLQDTLLHRRLSITETHL